MTKEELKEAIASTIVENGQKAITATALANLLNEIVDAAGSGGGSGSGGGGAIFVDTEATEPNESNASAYASLVNGWYNGVLYNVIASYIIPISVYAYVVDEEMGGVALMLDLTPIVGEVYGETYILKQDGSVEQLTEV